MGLSRLQFDEGNCGFWGLAIVDDFRRIMHDWVAVVDRQLDQYLGERLDCPPGLKEAMRYSLFAGGKRLRPLLVLLAADACRGGIDAAMPAACAIEMVHTYSLIHDDLPAMDNDDFRRGQPTSHRKYDEATAILAGDGLLTLAFEVLCDTKPNITAVQCCRVLANAAGAAGMVGGQADDLKAADGQGTVEWLESLHARKTGALLRAALLMGGLIAGIEEPKLHALAGYGERIGLAFQVADDLLDVEGEAKKLGKNVNKDIEAGKLTFPSLLGIEASRRRARELVEAAKEFLRPFGGQARHLVALADYIVERDR